LTGFDFSCFANHLKEHLLHEVGFLDGEHFFQKFGGSGPGEVFEEILSVLEHEPEEINVIIHL
jgi:hypothetical protein